MQANSLFIYYFFSSPDLLLQLFYLTSLLNTGRIQKIPNNDIGKTKDKYNFKKAVSLFNEAVSKNNKAYNLKTLQDAAGYFIRNSHNTGIIYDNR